MRFTADIILKRVQDGKMVERFIADCFTNQSKDPKFAEFLAFLSSHEAYIEEGVEMAYDGNISVNGVKKSVSKEFLYELYDNLD